MPLNTLAGPGRVGPERRVVLSHCGADPIQFSEAFGSVTISSNRLDLSANVFGEIRKTWSTGAHRRCLALTFVPA